MELKGTGSGIASTLNGSLDRPWGSMQSMGPMEPPVPAGTRGLKKEAPKYCWLPLCPLAVAPPVEGQVPLYSTAAASKARPVRPHLLTSVPSRRYFSGALRQDPRPTRLHEPHNIKLEVSHPPTTHLSRFAPLFLKLRRCLVSTIPSFNSSPSCLSEAKHRPSLS